MKRITSLMLSALAAGMLSGCGGDSSDDDILLIPEARGQVVDSAVSGLSYRCLGRSGVTDENGYFTCPAGSTVTFFIGDVTLGSVTARNNLTVTPGLLVGRADQNNLAMLLLALDDDGDPDNGIQLPEGLETWFEGQDIDFSDDSQFYDEGLVDNLVELVKGDTDADLPDISDVATHLAQSARDIVAGFYTGTVAIDGEGTRSFAAIVNHGGDIVGESWLRGDATSGDTESGNESDLGMPWINMYGAPLVIPSEPVIGIPEGRGVVLESELDVVLEEPEYNGTIENGVLDAEENGYRWRATRQAQTPLPLDAEAVADFTGGLYSLVLYIEGEEDEVGPRAFMEIMVTGDVEVFSNGDVVMRIPDWHCNGMSIDDPNYADCDELGLRYGGDEVNGIVTGVDGEAGTLTFVAMDNNIVVTGTLAKPVVIELEPRIAIEAGPATATLSGSWTADIVSVSGTVGGGSVID